MIPISQVDPAALKCHLFRVYLEVEKFYKDPENVKRYEEWKAARDAEAAKKGESL